MVAPAKEKGGSSGGSSLVRAECVVHRGNGLADGNNGWSLGSLAFQGVGLQKYLPTGHGGANDTRERLRVKLLLLYATSTSAQRCSAPFSV
jgi:hypothetical protein